MNLAVLAEPWSGSRRQQLISIAEQHSLRTAFRGSTGTSNVGHQVRSVGVCYSQRRIVLIARVQALGLLDATVQLEGDIRAAQQQQMLYPWSPRPTGRGASWLLHVELSGCTRSCQS